MRAMFDRVPSAYFTMPLVVRSARGSLKIAIVVWTIGALAGAGHLVQGIRGSEAPGEIRTDVRVLAERLALAALAVVAFRAISRRRPAGRWLTVALAVLMAYRLLPALSRALRGFSSTEEGWIALGKPAAQYFRSGTR